MNTAGTKETTISSLNERKLRIYNAINETIAIVEDCRMHRLGALRCAIQIFKVAILPALLVNSGTWEDILDPKVQKELEDFQSFLIRGLMAVPKSCPLPALTYESNSLLLKYQVFSRLLNLLKHIYAQDQESCLAKQILSEQLKNNWGGLSEAGTKICDSLGIDGLFDPLVSKQQFKQIVKKACAIANDDELKSQIQSYKKMAAMKDEILKGNCYFFKESLYNARAIFGFRVELSEAKNNFKNKQEYKNEGYLCDSCQSEIDQNTHVLFCPSYSSLREGKSLNNDVHLAQYLQKVLEIRTNLRLNR